MVSETSLAPEPSRRSPRGVGWARIILDPNANGTFTDSGDLDETPSYNEANELTGRDTDSNASDNYTPVFDAVGNQTDDGKDYTYPYHVWGRLREVHARSGGALVAEYRYNGNLVAEYSYDALGHPGQGWR